MYIIMQVSESLCIVYSRARTGQKSLQHLADLRVDPAKTYECLQNDREDFHEACAWHSSRGEPPPCLLPPSWSAISSRSISGLRLRLRTWSMVA